MRSNRMLISTALAVAALAGCSATPKPRGEVSRPTPVSVSAATPVATDPAPLRQASLSIPATQPAAAHPSGTEHLPQFGRELTPEVVVSEVLARNPTVAQMTAAVEMAAARYPQVTSLDDPVFSSWVAPASLGSNRVNDAARFEVSQKLPFPGKRALRGEAALATATAAGYDLEDTKLQLVEMAKAAYADYAFAERALEVNADGQKLLEEFKQNAETRYKTGQTPQQDVLQADVELGKQSEQRLARERAKVVAVARLNTLMSLPPESPLPPPAKDVGSPASLPEPKALRDLALSRRPDLSALAARISADAATLGVAEKEYYPDVEAMAAYDSFWQAADNQQRLRPQVGFRMNLPIRLDRRRGAVSEATAQLVQRRAELAKQQNQIGFDVQQAYAQVRESEQGVKLYAEKILPAARENVKSAQAAYVTGKTPFLALVEAQRSLVELRDRSYLAAADYERRRATLERVVGGPLQPASGPPPGR